ncbi:hypothetical protein NDU88_000405 [Pleurodeles waltl]|uniref:Uncharacterized protein n=1 Tax=Pleurodeles waltl TaxID=8319 RepID=A0AAV7V512_PLEWA|nr:hypothetical protein NDU88_000405 [Pleurodeles waltl]
MRCGPSALRGPLSPASRRPSRDLVTFLLTPQCATSPQGCTDAPMPRVPLRRGGSCAVRPNVQRRGVCGGPAFTAPMPPCHTPPLCPSQPCPVARPRRAHPTSLGPGHPAIPGMPRVTDRPPRPIPPRVHPPPRLRSGRREGALNLAKRPSQKYPKGDPAGWARQLPLTGLSDAGQTPGGVRGTQRICSTLGAVARRQEPAWGTSGILGSGHSTE